MVKANQKTKKEIQLEYLLSTRFTARDKAIIADLLLKAYKEGFINGYKIGNS